MPAIAALHVYPILRPQKNSYWWKFQLTGYHLAQINIANARDAMDSDVMRGFVNRLDEINALADKAPEENSPTEYAFTFSKTFAMH